MGGRGRARSRGAVRHVGRRRSRLGRLGQRSETEALRTRFAEAGSIDEKKKLTDEIQKRQFENGNFQAYLGQFFVATGFRDNVSGILNAPPFFWNIRKA